MDVVDLYTEQEFSPEEEDPRRVAVEAPSKIEPKSLACAPDKVALPSAIRA